LSQKYPKVTIGIPTYNRVCFLEQALESAMVQSYPNIEIVVSDNASTDSTRKLLTEYSGKVTVIHQQQNIGMTKNWDVCLCAATGEYFLLLSDDDYLDADAIQRLMNGYEQWGDSIAFVYGRTVVHKSNGDCYRHPVTPPELEHTADFVLECYRNQRFASAGAVLLRTSDMRAIGGYWTHHFNLVSDSAMMLGICLLNPLRQVKFVDATVFNYRVHSTNLTNSEKLDLWVEEILRLSNLIFAKLEIVAPGMCNDFIVWRDRYVISFVLGLAMECRHASFASRCRALCDCYRTCSQYLGFTTLKTFCSGALQLMSPGLYRLLGEIRR